MTDNVSPNTLPTHDELIKLTDLNQYPQPRPAVLQRATLKRTPSDFQVDEIMDVELSGEGEHLWLLIRKTGMNTGFVAQQLAKWASIPSRDVGYSGMKDRQAVTTQWFSLRLPKKQVPAKSFDDYILAIIAPQHDLEVDETNLNGHVESLQVLEQQWHSKKLNRGTHRANRFVITLHDVVLNTDMATTYDDAQILLAQSAAKGVPNYFGSQRFGRGGNNIAQALEWFEQGTINGRKPYPKKSRDTQSMLLSSARSLIFNQILVKRVVTKSWDTGLEGEVFNLADSGSVFASERLDDTLKQRLVDFDIHPTAPLWGVDSQQGGSGKTQSQQQALTTETAVVNDNEILKRLAHGLENKGLKPMRRSLRLMVNDFETCWLNDSTILQLAFALPTGTFATSVLASFVTDLAN